MGATAAGTAAATALGGSEALAAPVSFADFPGAPIIRRDVAVIGGGSAGTYAAVRLGDFGKSVVVVESKDRLGGHTETYHDPATGGTVDIGVIVFEDQPHVRAYFDRFQVGLTGIGGLGGTTAYVDFRTGKAVPFTPPIPTALGTYYGLISQYGPIDTFFNLPSPVPQDLVRPFSEFVAKYDLGSVVKLVFNYGQGIGNILDLPALYSINTFGQGVVRNILSGSFLTTAVHDNSLLYERATAALGANALLGTQVLLVDRNASGVKLLVATPTGPKLIIAKKLVVTIPPLLRNFAGFNLDLTEASVFAQFISGAYYTGVVRLSGLPDGVGLENIAANTPYNLPPLPGLYGVSPTGLPGLYNVKYGSPTPLSDEQVRRDIRTQIERVAKAGTYPVVFQNLETYASHTPFELHVTPQAIAAGFYAKLNALQGRNSTYYSGAAWHSHNSTRIWSGLETLLPNIAG
jgi:hypothetical protein